MSQPNTKTRILNAAEQLFARDGFHNTSMRAITSAADVNLAAVNYHFGTKEALLQEVFERHLIPLNLLRTERLQQVLDTADSAGHLPATTELLRAFIEPTLAFREANPGNRAFVALIGRSMAEVDSTVRDCFIHLIEPLFQLLFHSLQQALPNLSAEILVHRLKFTMGAMAHFMMMPGQPSLQMNKSTEPLNVDALSEELIRFACAGLEAPC